jgi:hypothetical protein
VVAVVEHAHQVAADDAPRHAVLTSFVPVCIYNGIYQSIIGWYLCLIEHNGVYEMYRELQWCFS